MELHGTNAKVQISNDGGQTWVDITSSVRDLHIELGTPLAPVQALLKRPRLRRSFRVPVRILHMHDVWYRYQARAVGWPRTN